MAPTTERAVFKIAAGCAGTADRAHVEVSAHCERRSSGVWNLRRYPCHGFATVARSERKYKAEGTTLADADEIRRPLPV